MLDFETAPNPRWNPLWKSATAVLRPEQDFSDQKPNKVWKPVTAGAMTHPPYKLTTEDLALLDRYVGIYAARFRYQSKVEDFRQDLVVELLRTNYLARYDPEQNSKGGYLNAFVRNFFCKQYKHAGYPVNRAIAVDDMEVALEDTPDDSPGPVDPKTWATLETIVARLERRFPANSGVKYNGRDFLGVVYVGEEAGDGEAIVWKSSANILMLTVMGFRQEEIARLFRVSKGWVFKQVKRIRQDPLVCSWAVEYDVTVKRVQSA